MKMEGYVPDKIIVSLGTNQYRDKDMSPVEKFYETLIGIYGTKIPILCITPIWRGDSLEELPVLIDFGRKVEKIAGKYDNVRIIDGMKGVQATNILHF